MMTESVKSGIKRIDEKDDSKGLRWLDELEKKNNVTSSRRNAASCTKQRRSKEAKKKREVNSREKGK